MPLFSKLRERFRNHARDEMYAALQALGIQAHMADRGCPEEKIWVGPRQSLGVINIAEGPVRWVNVTKATRASGGGWDPPLLYYMVYGVPDQKVQPGFPKVRLEAIFIRKGFLDFPIFGRVNKEVRWKGNDFGLGIVPHLGQDVSVTKALATSFARDLDSLEIRAYPSGRCWILTAQRMLAPSREKWDCYQAIARILLERSMSTDQ